MPLCLCSKPSKNIYLPLDFLLSKEPNSKLTTHLWTVLISEHMPEAPGIPNRSPIEVGAVLAFILGVLVGTCVWMDRDNFLSLRKRETNETMASQTKAFIKTLLPNGLTTIWLYRSRKTSKGAMTYFSWILPERHLVTPTTNDQGNLSGPKPFPKRIFSPQTLIT